MSRPPAQASAGAYSSQVSSSRPSYPGIGDPSIHPRPTSGLHWNALPLSTDRANLACVSVYGSAPVSVDGRGSRRAAGGTSPAVAAAPAVSGSRSWCRPFECTARPWWPTRGRWPGRRQAARRTRPAAPQLAGLALGRAKSPPWQLTNACSKVHSSVGLEEGYQGESWMLDSPEGVCAGQARPEYPATSVAFST
jgi:hypothetical protein